ncbi:liprin-alpha-1-like isoform X1 [Moschus berezovskii]|uniref:liprin-alpha-1-like isoform X1 n=1 Tax=Moschus berezovskii TaxID=68408 RepID=UPI0024439B2B|nr:liprin-alpha-1-like isoform X1 [Moschus berezovskii]XP_055264960.1 liprin-alpha-1-like isoform X1 [Moschus berezovskii]
MLDLREANLLTVGSSVQETLCTGHRVECFPSLSSHPADTQLPAIPEEVGDIEGTTSTPASPQSLQLDRLHPGALHTASHEAIRDACNLTGSQDSPGSNPSSSSSSSSQDSPHKAAKNKSIRYSISRIFQKK